MVLCCKVEAPITNHLRILAYEIKVYNFFRIFHLCKHKLLVECKKFRDFIPTTQIVIIIWSEKLPGTHNRPYAQMYK